MSEFQGAPCRATTSMALNGLLKVIKERQSPDGQIPVAHVEALINGMVQAKSPLGMMFSISEERCATRTRVSGIGRSIDRRNNHLIRLIVSPFDRTFGRVDSPWDHRIVSRLETFITTTLISHLDTFRKALEMACIQHRRDDGTIDWDALLVDSFTIRIWDDILAHLADKFWRSKDMRARLKKCVAYNEAGEQDMLFLPGDLDQLVRCLFSPMTDRPRTSEQVADFERRHKSTPDKLRQILAI